MVLDVPGGLFTQRDVRETAGQFTDLTLTAEAQGAVLYFNGSNWVVLTVGTAGYVLKTQGAAANPAWTNTVDNAVLAAHASDLVIASEAAGDVLYCDGSNWVRLAKGTDNQVLTLAGGVPSWAASVGGWAASSKSVARNAVKILFLEADGSVTSSDYDDIWADVFEDATGYNNTVNTGNTTAYFETADKQYSNKIYSGGTDRNTTNTDDSEMADYNINNGPKITVGANPIKVNTITKFSADTSTKCYIYSDASYTVLASASFSGNAATFSNAILSANTTYWIGVNSDGANRTMRYDNVPTFPEDLTDFSFTASWYDNGTPTTINDTTKHKSVAGINCSVQTPTACLIETDALTTTSSNVTHMMVVADGDTSNITADLSGDNKANWDTAKALNTKHAITVAGTQPCIKVNIDNGGGSSEKVCNGYAVILWTV